MIYDRHQYLIRKFQYGGIGRTLLDQNGKVITESEYRKLWENQQIEGQILPEAEVYAYNSPEQYLNDRMNTSTGKNTEAILSAPKAAAELITEAPANFIGEVLQGKNFDYRRIVPQGIRDYTGWNVDLLGRRGSDSVLGAGEVDADGIRHADIYLGKARNFALDVVTDPWSFIGAGAMKQSVVAAEKKLLMDATQRGIKIAPKKLNKLLTNELQRELGKNIDQNVALENAFSNVARKELHLQSENIIDIIGPIKKFESSKFPDLDKFSLENGLKYKPNSNRIQEVIDNHITDTNYDNASIKELEKKLFDIEPKIEIANRLDRIYINENNTDKLINKKRLIEKELNAYMLDDVVNEAKREKELELVRDGFHNIEEASVYKKYKSFTEGLFNKTYNNNIIFRPDNTIDFREAMMNNIQNTENQIKTTNFDKKVNNMRSSSYSKNTEKVYSKLKDMVTPELIKKHGEKYAKEITDPRNVEKYRRIDALEKNTNATLSLNAFVKDKTKFDNFSISSMSENYDMLGLSKFDLSNKEIDNIVDSYIIRHATTPQESIAMRKSIMGGEMKKETTEFFESKALEQLKLNKPYGRYVELHMRNPELYKTVSHELKHNINGGGVYLGKEYNKMIRSVFIGPKTLKGAPLDEYNYFTDPSEFSSYLGTNLKDELVSKGLIKSVHDDVTEDILLKLEESNSVLHQYIPFVKSRKKLVDAINITPYAIGGGAMFNKNK